MNEIRVNKIEAARRQIDTAIRLLFDNDDPVSIHTLAAAGFKIVRDIAKDNPKCNMDSVVKSMIKSDMLGPFWSAIHRPSNFFKHADTDPEGILDGVQEEYNDVTLFLACLWYQDLGYKLTPEMVALVTWFTIMHPNFLKEGASIKPLLNLAGFKEFRSENRNGKLEVGKLLIGLARKQ